MASTKVWFAKDATIAIGAVISSVASGSTLASQFTATSTWTSRVKNLKITGASRDISPINVMGIQQLKQRDRPEIVTCTFNTVIYPMGSTGANSLMDFLFGNGAAVGATGYNRYQGGEHATDRSDNAVLITLSRPGTAVTDTVTFLLNNSDVVSGDITQDAESHTEQEWIVKCLAGDFYTDAGVTVDPAT